MNHKPTDAEIFVSFWNTPLDATQTDKEIAIEKWLNFRAKPFGVIMETTPK